MNAVAFTLNELVQRFGGTVVGDGNCRLTGVAPLDRAKESELSFLTNPKYLPQVSRTAAAAVLMTPADFEKIIDSAGRAYLLTANPYAHFARIAQLFASLTQPEEPGGVHASAVIDPTAQVSADARIGPFVMVEAGAVIGARVRIDAHVTIGKQVRIGAQSHLYPHVSVYRECMLGERVIVHSGAVIGADGFGFAPDFTADGGEWVKIPQVGRVCIEDDVEIGANTTIDRGTIGDTVIEHGVKIDNLVQIGHNCKIGAYTVIAGCSGIAGSTTLGKHCIIGGAVGIAGHLTLADHVTIAAKSGVSKSLDKAGVYNSAFPAIEHAVWNRNAALMRNLDTMRARLKRLEAQFAELQEPR